MFTRRRELGLCGCELRTEMLTLLCESGLRKSLRVLNLCAISGLELNDACMLSIDKLEKLECLNLRATWEIPKPQVDLLKDRLVNSRGRVDVLGNEDLSASCAPKKKKKKKRRNVILSFAYLKGKSVDVVRPLMHTYNMVISFEPEQPTKQYSSTTLPIHINRMGVITNSPKLK